jgi:hypothetical protein
LLLLPKHLHFNNSKCLLFLPWKRKSIMGIHACWSPQETASIKGITASACCY